MQLRLAIPDLLHSKKIKNVQIYWALRNNLYKEKNPDVMYFLTRKVKKSMEGTKRSKMAPQA
jgi:hypothetical protein